MRLHRWFRSINKFVLNCFKNVLNLDVAQFLLQPICVCVLPLIAMASLVAKMFKFLGLFYVRVFVLKKGNALRRKEEWVCAMCEVLATLNWTVKLMWSVRHRPPPPHCANNQRAQCFTANFPFLSSVCVCVTSLANLHPQTANLNYPNFHCFQKVTIFGLDFFLLFFCPSVCLSVCLCLASEVKIKGKATEETWTQM